MNQPFFLLEPTDVWEHLPVRAGRSCSGGARAQNPAAALPGQGTATSQSSLGLLSPATASPALTLSSSAKPQALLPSAAPYEAPFPSCKGGSQPGGNDL